VQLRATQRSSSAALDEATFSWQPQATIYTLYYANILPDGLDAEHIKAHSAAVGRMLSVQY
jgi:hypothetical protein